MKLTRELSIQHHLSKVQVLPKNAYLCDFVDVTKQLVLLRDGVVSRERSVVEKKTAVVAFHYSSDLCNIPEIVTKHISFRLRCATACQILAFDETIVRRAMKNQDTLKVFLQKAVDELFTAYLWQENTSRRTAAGRVAFLICDAARRLGANGAAPDPPRFRWPITQHTVGNACGISHVHVNRVFKELSGRGLISVRAKTVTILNWQGLSELV